MSKVLKNIHVLFIWFAWAFLTAHLMIPHDHHLLESFNDKEESCPASNGNTKHHTEFPVHCHAFNNLASEKAITFVLKKIIQSDDALFSISFANNIYNFQFSLITSPDIREPFPDSYLLEFSSLRAPPSKA